MSSSRPAIPPGEFEARLVRVQAEMHASGLDVCFVYGDEYRREYLRYVSNYWPIFERGALIIPREGEPILVAAPEGEEVAREMSPWSDIRLTQDFACVTVPEEVNFGQAHLTSLEDIFAELRGRQSISTLGVVGIDAMSPLLYWALEAALAGVKLVDCNDILVRLRLIKSENEVACLREAGRLADLAYERLMATCTPGKIECEVAAVAEGAARAAGAEFIPFTVFGSGKRTDSIVGRASRKVIREGEMIMASLAVQYEGYIATVEIPFVAGQMTQAQRTFINALIVAEGEALETLRHGRPARDFVRTVKANFQKQGLEAYDVYPPLHGIGYAEAEAPYPDENSNRILQSGMAVNTDISLFRSPVGSNRIEEGFIIREGEPEPLSPLIRRLATEWLGR